MILRSIDLSFTVFMAAFFDLSMSSYMVEMSAEEAFSSLDSTVQGLQGINLFQHKFNYYDNLFFLLFTCICDF